MLYKILLGLFILAVSAALIFGPKALRVYNFIHLFDEDKIAYNFININKIFPTIPIVKSSSPHVFKKQDFELPESYELDGKTYNLAESLDYFKSDGLIVLHNGDLLYENYWQGNSQDQPHISLQCLSELTKKI